MAARLAILSLTLARFRSYAAAELVPGGHSVALHGPNGAGKTNLLEAVSLLSPGRGLRGAAPEDLAQSPPGTGWKLRARIRAGGEEREVVTFALTGAARSVEIDGKAVPQTALARLLRMVWLTPAMDRLWTEGAGERRRFLDRLTLSFEPGHAELSIAYEKAMKERNRLLKEAARDPRWYEALEAQMARAGAAIARNRLATLDRLHAAQEGAATAFPRAQLALSGPEGGPPETEEAALREAFAKGRARDLAAGRTLAGPHRADLAATFAAKGVEARLSSTGEQKALLIALLLANARALAAGTGAPPVLLLDEVAAHLDEARRAALYDEIGVLGAQAFLTGTGPELFAALGDRARYLAVTEGEGGSRIGEG